MHSSDRKKWSPPRIERLDASLIAQKDWTREQLLQARTAVKQALELIEGDGGMPEVVARLQAILDALDCELERCDESMR